MAVRRENDHHAERSKDETPEQSDAGTEASPVIGQPRVRPEMIEVAESVVVKRRSLLKRLADYDRGEDAGR